MAKLIWEIFFWKGELLILTKNTAMRAILQQAEAQGL